MAQDDILIRYKVDTTDLDKASVAVADVTAETKQLQTQIKATFSDKSIEQATKDLYEQGDVMGALITKYGSATTALKAMEKELATMSALGQRNTAQFKELANATAELKDNIGDTRGEIKKMASDTRVFDTMVQGARGITAAFSVATGVTAVFGKESEDLQKAILKVQGAMAALQGVQELANIATEKGGIATKAYGAALQVVDKISKVTGLSMAASWALATGGITLAIAGIVSLISYLTQAKDETDTYTDSIDRNKKSQEELNKIVNDRLEIEKSATRDSVKIIDLEIAAIKEKQIANKSALDQAAINSNLQSGFNKELKDEVDRLSEQDKEYTKQVIILSNRRKFAIEDELKSRKPLPTTPQVTGTDNLPLMTTVEPLVTDDVVDMNKRNAEQMNKDLKQFAFDKSTKDMQAFQQQVTEIIGNSISAISGLTNSIFSNETSQLEVEKNRQLEIAGDNSNKREKIEKDFAIKKAKIDRQQAIANKIFSIFDISIRTAQAIMRAYSDTGPIAGSALAGITAAIGAIQIAAVAAQPLPAIPTFEKGGKVLAGGKKNDGHLFGRSHRDGGILIEAQGGEYIWDIPTVQKHGDIIKAAHENRLEDLILHKYVAPVLSNAPQNSSDSYDDVLLRKTIRDTSKESAKMIVRGVSESVKDSIYFQTRYR